MRCLFVLFVFLAGQSAWAEIWKVRGAGAEFFLDSNPNYLHYSGKVVRGKITLKNCNRDLAKALVQSLRKELTNPMSFIPGKGIRVILDNERLSDVSVKSNLALKFITMDDRFQQFKLAQESACSSR